MTAVGLETDLRVLWVLHSLQLRQNARCAFIGKDLNTFSSQAMSTGLMMHKPWAFPAWIHKAMN